MSLILSYSLWVPMKHSHGSCKEHKQNHRSVVVTLNVEHIAVVTNIVCGREILFQIRMVFPSGSLDNGTPSFQCSLSIWMDVSKLLNALWIYNLHYNGLNLGANIQNKYITTKEKEEKVHQSVIFCKCKGLPDVLRHVVVV